MATVYSKQPQKELIPGGMRSLYDHVQVDSDVERTFVDKRLIPDESNLAVYFKFPPKFRIEVPKIIGNYNPDWGLVRFTGHESFSVELVRETKGNDDLGELRFASEALKIKAAQRYFAALGIDYRHLSPEVDMYWLPANLPASVPKRGLSLVHSAEKPRSGYVAVPVYSLRAAASAFSDGQAPDEVGRVHLPRRVARLPGLFIAQIVGDSMDRLAASGAYGLWQHLGATGAAAPAVGECLIARREGLTDPDLGEFTFKRWKAVGAKETLEPMSTNRAHAPIELSAAEKVVFIARFVQVLLVS